MNEEFYQQMLEVVKKYHAGQTREGGVEPYWPHCERVAIFVKKAFENSHEGLQGQQQETLLAALGHDLYEDTIISKKEIIENFGSSVDVLIEELTNRDGDEHAEKYAEKLKSDSEQALLIKLADLCDNYGTGATSLPQNGFEWTKGFLWPILNVQWLAVKDLKFKQFPKTSEFLMLLVEKNRESLKSSLHIKASDEVI